VGNVDKQSPAFAEITERIAQLGLEVEFTGSLTHQELLQTYSEARLNALPSNSEGLHFEGFGLIHLEANACGTLTVGTLGSGNEDAIQDGFGSLVPYGNVSALARIISDSMSVDPYPRLPSERLRTWGDVARDYASILRNTLRLAQIGRMTPGAHTVELAEPLR
jgi:glycosyltransferase involved in cell wall biosynthesis